jgi:hypothetical protein
VGAGNLLLPLKIDRRVAQVIIEKAPPADDESRSCGAILVANTFPPSLEVGAFRVGALTDYLCRKGWLVDVLTGDPRSYPMLDWKSVEHIAGGYRVLAVAQDEPWWHRSAKRAVQLIRGKRAAATVTPELSSSVETFHGHRSAGRLPSAETVYSTLLSASRNRSWNDRVVSTGLGLRDRPHRVVVSSTPPHFLHEAASRLAKELRVPHVIDLRDPWTPFVGWRNLAQLAAEERPDNTLTARAVSGLYHAAAAVVCNTEAAAEALAASDPSLEGRIHTVRNGSDLSPRPRRVPRPGEPFTIVHTGWLYWRRDPRPFLRAIAATVRALALAPTDLRVVFMGPQTVIEGEPLPIWAEREGISSYIESRPAGPRQAVLELLEQAAMTVTFQGGESTRIPAKLYEYVSFPAWVLALASSGGATARLLAGTEAFVADILDSDGIQRAVTQAYVRFREGYLPDALDRDGAFSRERQSAIFESLLQQVQTAVPPVRR